MAQKIDAMHGAHNIPQHTPSTGVYSKGDMVYDAICIAKVYEKRNLELEAQARIIAELLG